MNKRCIILGSGYSLKGFKFWSLKDEDVFAVNKMGYFAPFAKNIVFWDGNFYDRERKKLNKLKGKKHTICYWTRQREDNRDPNIEYWINYGYEKIAREKPFVSNSNMSVLFAINIALHQGYKEIYLLGCDNKLTDNYVHFYDKEKSMKMIKNYIVAFSVMRRFCGEFKKQLFADEKIITVGDTDLSMFDNVSIEEFNDKIL